MLPDPDERTTAFGILLFGAGVFNGVLVGHVAGVLAGVAFSFILILAALGVLYHPFFEPPSIDDEEEEDDHRVWVYTRDGLLFTVSIWALLLIAYVVFGYYPPLEALTIPLIVGVLAVAFRLIVDDPILLEDLVHAVAKLIWKKPDPLHNYFAAEIIALFFAFMVVVGCLAVMVVTDALTRIINLFSELKFLFFI